jgi:hypothetical protein
MAGVLTPVTSAVNYTIPDTLVCGMTLWVKNSSAGDITITAPTNGFFRDGTNTMTLPTLKNACFVNDGGTYIHARYV